MLAHLTFEKGNLVAAKNVSRQEVVTEKDIS
jgi:hypothetical protein